MKPHANADTPVSRAKRQKSGALLAHLRGSLPSMTGIERIIAESVLSDPEKVVGSTIAAFSQNCGASVGSVIGFARKLKLKGFADFKIALARDLAESGLPASAEANHGTTLEKVISFQTHCLNEVLKINDEETFQDAVQVLAKARKIEFFSMGISHPVALSAAGKMTLIGMPASTQADSHLQLVAATHLKKGDVAFGISCSGTTRETINCLKVAREREARTICITNAMDSAITEVSDIALFATPSEIKYFQAPLASRITQLALIDALFVELAQKAKRRTAEILQRSGEELLKYRF